MSFLRLALLAAATVVACGATSCASARRDAAPPRLLTTTPLENEGMHARNVELIARAMKAADAQLVFLGDSITQGWEGVPALWESEFGRWSPLNLGVSGDRTEHVLWRLAEGTYDHLHPRLIVVMIGTNNTGHRMDAPADIAAGIDAILGDLARRFPRATVVLLSIFPRGATPTDPGRLNNAEVNRLLPLVAAAHGAQWLDVQGAFLDAAGNLPTTVMPDLLHPNAAGYAIWAEALRAPLARWLQP